MANIQDLVLILCNGKCDMSQCDETKELSSDWMILPIYWSSMAGIIYYGLGCWRNYIWFPHRLGSSSFEGNQISCWIDHCSFSHWINTSGHRKSRLLSNITHKKWMGLSYFKYSNFTTDIIHNTFKHFKHINIMFRDMIWFFLLKISIGLFDFSAFQAFQYSSCW